MHNDSVRFLVRFANTSKGKAAVTSNDCLAQQQINSPRISYWRHFILTNKTLYDCPMTTSRPGMAEMDGSPTCVPKMAIYAARFFFPVTSAARLHVAQASKDDHVNTSPTLADCRRLWPARYLDARRTKSRGCRTQVISRSCVQDRPFRVKLQLEGSLRGS
jgi:hypothetical protein